MTLSEASTISGMIWTRLRGEGKQAVLPPLFQAFAAEYAMQPVSCFSALLQTWQPHLDQTISMRVANMLMWPTTVTFHWLTSCKQYNTYSIGIVRAVCLCSWRLRGSCL